MTPMTWEELRDLWKSKTTIPENERSIIHLEQFIIGFNAGYQYGKEWISVEDSPLFTEDKTGCWILTEAGCKEFLAAVPYADNKRPDEKNLWWIRHCVIGDSGLEIVGDDDNDAAGWSLKDVTHYWLIEPPKI